MSVDARKIVRKAHVDLGSLFSQLNSDNRQGFLDDLVYPDGPGRNAFVRACEILQVAYDTRNAVRPGFNGFDNFPHLPTGLIERQRPLPPFRMREIIEAVKTGSDRISSVV